MKRRLSAVLAAPVLTMVACGGGGHPAAKSGNGYEEYECAQPIGRTVREDCSRTARRGAYAKTAPQPASVQTPSNPIAVGADCPGPPAVGRPIFSEDFESGADRWITTREATGVFTTPGSPLVIGRDPAGSACNTQYQRETLPWGWGRAFTKDPIPVRPNASYCVSAWIRCSANAAGCLGVSGSNATWKPLVPQSEWLVCRNGYAGRLGGGQSVAVIADSAWHRYNVPFKTSADQTHVLIMSELWNEGAPGTADFDDIRLYEGDCPR